MIPVTQQIKLALSLLPAHPEQAEANLQALCEKVYKYGVNEGYRECSEKVLAKMQPVEVSDAR